MLYNTIDVSASQIETWEDCARKWALDKIDKMPRAASPAADLGTAVHLILEKWQRDAEVIDSLTREGKIAMTMIKHLPPPMTPGVEVETWIDFYLFDVVHVRGRIDWKQWNLPVPKTGDHKTTSDFKWAKSAKDLETDIQANIYAFDSMVKTKIMLADLQWTYATTGSHPQSKVVSLRTDQEKVSLVMNRVYDVSTRMLAMKNEFGGEQGAGITYPYNAGACDNYGGCAYRNICNLSSREKTLSVLSQLKNGVLAERGLLHPTKKIEETDMATTAEVMAKLKAKKAADVAGGSPAASEPVLQRVNAGDAPPPSPPPKQIDGAWVVAVYDPLKGAWGFPGEEAPPKKAAAAAPAAAPAAGGLMSRIKKPNATTLTSAPKDVPVVNLDAPAAATPADVAVVSIVKAMAAVEEQATAAFGGDPIDYERLSSMTAKKVISALASALHLVNG